MENYSKEQDKTTAKVIDEVFKENSKKIDTTAYFSHDGLAAFRLAVLQAVETYEYKAPPPVPELQQMFLKDNFFSSGKSNRNIRRKAERKAKKNK